MIIRWQRRFNGSNIYWLDDASLAIAVVIGKLLDQRMKELRRSSAKKWKDRAMV